MNDRTKMCLLKTSKSRQWYGVWIDANGRVCSISSTARPPKIFEMAINIKRSKKAAPPDFEVSGQNNSALFTLRIYRGEGMALLAMNWSNGKPPDNFVGFAIEYQEPGGSQFFAVRNRISFLKNDGNVNPNIQSSRLSPIQKFRWVHFPFRPDLPGEFIYRVTPVFMDINDELS